MEPLAWARDAALETVRWVAEFEFPDFEQDLPQVALVNPSALRLIAEYEPPTEPAVPAPPVAGTGAGCTEAPRGICYHRYRVDARGTVLDARIVPPTSQHQKGIDRDLHRFAESALDLSHDQLVWKCEQIVRNYDPCISCATHFPKVRRHREDDG